MKRGRGLYGLPLSATALAAGSALLGERISVTRFVRWDNDPQASTEPPTPPKDLPQRWLVTKAPEFLELSRSVAMHIAAANPASLDKLLKQPYVRDPAISVDKTVRLKGA